jgi:hypothetical protein
MEWAHADASGSRLLDMALEDGAQRSPLSGLFPANLALPSLEVALMPHSATLPHLHPSTGRSVKMALKQAKRAQAKHPDMTLDECTAIVLYTMEEIPRETSLYYVLNLALRNKVRAAVTLWRDYIWLLLHALRKLPPSTEATVFRGCKKSPADLGIELSKGFEFTWSSFTSTATTQGVMQTFLGKSDPRTLMTIKMVESSGRDIRDFSLYPGENEILFPPNLCFEVVDSYDAGNHLIMVQCRQTETVDVILDLNGKRTGGGGVAGKATASKPTPQPPAQPFKAPKPAPSYDRPSEQVKNFRGPCSGSCVSSTGSCLAFISGCCVSSAGSCLSSTGSCLASISGCCVSSAGSCLSSTGSCLASISGCCVSSAGSCLSCRPGIGGRPGIGDRVRVAKSGPHFGRRGRITTDDKTSNPYRVTFDDGTESEWLYPHEVRAARIMGCLSCISSIPGCCVSCISGCGTSEQVKNFRGPCADCCKPLALFCCVSADGEAIFGCVPTDRQYFLPACLHMALCPQLGCDPMGGQEDPTGDNSPHFEDISCEKTWCFGYGQHLCFLFDQTFLANLMACCLQSGGNVTRIGVSPDLSPWYLPEGFEPAAFRTARLGPRPARPSCAPSAERPPAPHACSTRFAVLRVCDWEWRCGDSTWRCCGTRPKWWLESDVALLGRSCK